MQPVKFTFKKRGLSPNEFEDCLNSKVNELFRDLNTYGIVTLMKDCVQKVRKNVCIRENRTTNSLDRKHSHSAGNLAVSGLLPNAQITPMQHRKNTGGEKGRQRSDREAMKRYHDKQHDLFSEFLIPKFSDLFHYIILKEDNKGYFFWRRNSAKLTTEQCCYIIDRITTEYIRYFFQLSPNTVNPDHDKKRAELQAEYACCEFILMARGTVDWSTENNLVDRKGYNDWRSHVLVEISYAALAVVLAMILSRLDKGWALAPAPAPAVRLERGWGPQSVMYHFIVLIIGSALMIGPPILLAHQLGFGVRSAFFPPLLLLYMWVAYTVLQQLHYLE